MDVEWTNAEIADTFLGIEDHGLFAWSITFKNGSFHQGTGLRAVDRVSLPTIEAIVRIFGPWNRLQGKLVRIGRENRAIVAVRDILDDEKEVRL